MGAIGGMLGLGGGASGTGYDKPQLAGLMQGVTEPQVDSANAATQAALGGQGELLAALRQQQGLEKQNQIFNALGNTANQYQNLASGTGPNPAQAMLNQATGQNVANQAALMAGQRGASQNAGLIARQAAMQGANTQQQMAGQAAVNQANQQIAGLQGLSNIQGQQAGLANTIAGNQIGAQNAYVGNLQNQQANLLNALNQYNQNSVNRTSSVNAGNTALASKGMEGQQSFVGGLMNAGSAAIGAMAEGGEVGGSSSFMSTLNSLQNAAANPRVTVENKEPEKPETFDMSGTASGKQLQTGVSKLGNALVSKFSSKPGLEPVSSTTLPATQGIGMMASHGGLVDVVVSPGEKIISPENAKHVAMGGKAQGTTVPGKAEVSGDSYKNDKVPAKLPPGTIVVKRTRANNDPEGFIRQVLAKRKASK